VSDKPLSDDEIAALRSCVWQGARHIYRTLGFEERSAKAVEMQALFDRLVAELRQAREEIAEDRAVCICGCPNEVHENVGAPDEGEQCENEAHECFRVCVAARDALRDERRSNASLRAQLEEAKRDSERWQRKAEALYERGGTSYGEWLKAGLVDGD